MESNYVRV